MTEMEAPEMTDESLAPEAKHYADAATGKYLGLWEGCAPDVPAIEVPAPVNTAQVWDIEGGVWGDVPDEALAVQIRLERDRLLTDSDVYALPDYPHGDDVARQAWLDYRQALRDVTAQATFPDTVEWPVPPAS